MRRVRILHISDLHEKGGREHEPWRRRRVLGNSWVRNLDEVAAEGPIDIIAFTGDAANWGKPDEFARAAEFLHATRERLALAPDRVFVIPGNHDIDRSIEVECWAGLRKALANTADLLSAGRWIAGGEPPPGFSANWRDLIANRLAAYRRWVSDQLGRPELAGTETTLGYRATLQLDGIAYAIHILGLNTAWLCGDDNDNGKLWGLEEQLMRIACSEEGEPLTGLRLLLMHHPFNHLADGPGCRRLLDKHVDLVLRGHLHEEETEIWSDPNRSVRQIAAGSLYEGWRADQWQNSCHVISVEPDAAGLPSGIEMRFRTWSGRSGAWHDDNSLYSGASNGRMQWQLPLPSTPVAGAGATILGDPWTPAVPPVFVGRDMLLRKLHGAWEQGRSISLVGDWRIGKSSILATCYKDISKSGRPVRLLNGESREGASSADFVRAATGVAVIPEQVDAAADVLSSWARQSRRNALLPVLLIDECDALVRRFDHRFFERLRGMLDDLCLGVSSRRELDRVFEDNGKGASPFQNRLELHWVGLLEAEAAESLMARIGAGLPVQARVPVREWAGRHPFFIQLMTRKLVDAHRFGQSEVEARDEFQTEAAARLREIWGTLTPREQQIMIQAGSIPQPQSRSLRQRGLLDEAGRHFGRVLTEWLADEVT